MAYFRTIYTSFWTDPTVEEDFTPEDKFFMLYVLTNPHTNMCGCYEISLKRISDEMGYSRNEIEEILRRFKNEYKGAVLYDGGTHELFIRNWYKYNWNDSPKLDGVLREEIEQIKNISFKKHLIDLYNNRVSVREGRSISIVSCDYEGEEIGDDAEYKDDSQIGMEVPLLDAPLLSGESDGNAGSELAFNPPVEIQKNDSASEEEKKGICPYDEIKDMFNEICISYPKVRAMGKSRKVYVCARWQEHGKNLEIFREVFVNMEQSDFLRGDNGKWTASFDWAMLPTNFVKILEGNYRNKRVKSSGASAGWQVIQEEAAGGQA